jgi:signal transduction histidine kinase
VNNTRANAGTLERAALRRVATLVAQGVQSHELFAAVAEEVGRVVDAPSVSVSRYEDDGAVTVCGTFPPDSPRFPIGARVTLDGNSVPSLVRERAQSARLDDYTELKGEIGEAARSSGMHSSVGAPIVVAGHVWGAIIASNTELLPENTEGRLAEFTELVAAAIANTEARESLAGLADEQAALRRVATLVAQGVPRSEVFSAVTSEVARLFPVAGPPLVATVIRFDPGPECVLVGASRPYEREPIGSRWSPKDLYVSSRVFRDRRPARINEADLDAAGGPDAEVLRLRGFLYQVGAPVFVEGRLWGAMTLNSNEELPLDTDGRLENFTELVATAIGNGESRDALAELADEQAALRRVATLVARDAPPSEVFDAVAMEVGTLLDTDITVVGRYDGDGAATAIGSWSASPGGVPVGTRSLIGGRNVLTLVAETGKPARVDGYDDASGEAADIARDHGWRASIAAPIIVEGRLWGVMLVATQRPEAFPAGAEARLSAFTDLVATALANAQAHDEVRRFGEEQAALGRVATLVAAGAAPEQVFTAVVDEASSLLGLERIEFVRYDGSNTGTVIAASGEHPFPPGSTWSLEHPSVMATVARTKRAARIDDYGALKGEIARAARSAGFQSAIGAPLTVEGHLWGVIIAISTDPEPIPERSEARLGQFTELVATAVANAEARRALERVAAEQATLRRIATLVARGVQPEELFAAVAEETAATFDALTAVMRFEHDPPGVSLVGVSKETGLPIGTRWAFVEGMASAEVYRTGRPARLTTGADYWSWHSSGPVAEAGRRLGIVSQVSCPIVFEGGVWGVITVNAGEELPPDTEQRLEKFTDLLTTAIANAEGKSELAASRRRIVTAADEARRRIERNLHDGTQQRLIALGLDLQRVRATIRADPAAQTGFERMERDLESILEDLRELSRGLHPPLLSRAGLRPALRALARRSPIPVQLHVDLPERPPAEVETAIYYVVSEALANAIKHSQASAISVTISSGPLADGPDGLPRTTTLHAAIADDGVGGAEPSGGSGLIGLADRVEALGGTISIASPPRGGTALSVHLPTTA